MANSNFVRLLKVGEAPVRAVMKTVYKNYPEWNSTSITQSTIPPFEYRQTDSTLEPPKSHRRGPYSGILSPRGGSRAWKSVKAVHHLKTKLDMVLTPIDIVGGRVISAGGTYERTESITYECPTPYHACFYVTGLSASQVQSIIKTGTGGIQNQGTWYHHDLYALIDAYEEALRQTMPSETIIGESIVEYEIFKDLALAMINPPRAIQTFVKATHKFFHDLPRGRQSSYTMGQAARALVKTSANKHLTYQFGVKPAIGELELILQARDLVRARMNTLQSAAGRYVPIRVRQKIHNPFTNNSLTPSTYFQLVWQRLRREQVANIGCYARVRQDIDNTAAWQYYVDLFGLHKLPGLLWELIPYSFCLDWVFDVQERINRSTTAPMWSPFTEIVATCSSYKNVISDELYLKSGNWISYTDPTMSPKGPVLVARRETTDYKRFPGLPEASATFNYRALEDPSKQALSASMVANRFLPTYRRIDLSKLR